MRACKFDIQSKGRKSSEIQTAGPVDAEIKGSFAEKPQLSKVFSTSTNKNGGGGGGQGGAGGGGGAGGDTDLRFFLQRP